MPKEESLEKGIFLEKEKKKEYGKNVTIHAFFVRHGEKKFDLENPNTLLTLRGKEQARKAGQSLQEREAIKGYSSDTERTKETAELIVFESPTGKKMKLRKKDDLAFVWDPNGEFTKDFTKLKKENLGSDYENLSKSKKEQRFLETMAKLTDFYLKYKDKRPDPKTYSPVETAATVALRLDKYLRMARKLEKDSDIDLVNATHDFNIAAFLKEVMLRKVGEKVVRGFDSIDEIGGPIDFTEGFEIAIKLDEQGKESLKLLFRGQEYEVDRQRLEELKEIAHNLKQDESEND